MSVLKSKRQESKFEVFHHFFKLRKELTGLVYHRFGYRGNDAAASWFIDGESRIILRNLAEAQKYMTMANSIFPNCLMECDERRRLQDLAIGLHYDFLQELQFALEMLPLDKNKYTRYVDMINKEIALMKGWRQSDNAIRKRIMNNIKG